VLFKDIEKIGRPLRLLSLHSTLDISATLEYEDFRKVCESCPNLEQLEHHFSEPEIGQMIQDEYLYVAPLFVSYPTLSNAPRCTSLVYKCMPWTKV
jgi:hypothetical protein